ncbi:MAG: NAD kinase [Betaproteobacteria bacterium HGW-Betaproteobacteria-8]|nr:MAG: NAD kinase [Betaproteobacteria bacterium HGW-Betaproteobacteria-8]
MPAMKSIFKNIALIGKFMNAETSEHIGVLARFLSEQGLGVVIEEITAQQSMLSGYAVAPIDNIGQDVDLAIVLGGDGTMLTAARSFVDYDIPLIGVNRGRFGFLTDLEAENMLEGITQILAGEFDKEDRMLLTASLQRDGQLITKGYALNDVVINKNGAAKLIELEVYINGQFVHRQRSDGLIVSTPTGTTAYSLSAGGPILHPTLDAIALVPICAHTLSNRPIAINSASRVEVTLMHAEDACVNFDGQLHSSLLEGDKMIIGRAKETITLLHPRGHSHFAMLREKLNWG